MIWAQDQNGGIGKDSQLPWHLSEDLKNFKKITLNNSLVMGRKTWDSLPVKPLPKRENIIISSSKSIDGAHKIFNNISDCIKYVSSCSNPIFIIGGAMIYKQFFKHSNRLHITIVKKTVENIDTFFPYKMSDIEKQFSMETQIELNDDAIYTIWQRN